MVIDFLRSWLLDDPRAARAFVSGPAEVTPSDMAFGLDGSTYQPAEYVNYPATSNGVYACINARTRALGGLPIKLYSKRLDADGNRKEITAGPARDLLDTINPFWTFGRWLDMTEQSLCVWGESFTFYAKAGNRPVELWWARADQVKVHPHPTEYISHFTLDTGNGQPIRFERDETLWLRYPNVADQWEGLSPLAAARLAADTSSAAMKSNYQIFRNGLTASGMVSPLDGQTLTEDQAKSIAEHLTRRFQGVENAHKIAVLRFGVDIKQLSLTPKDAEFLGMLNWTLEDICRAYGVPIDKIGGKRTYQNVDDSEKVFWTDCIIPEAKFIASEITEQLLPLFGGDMVAEFDDSDVDVLHEAESAKWEREAGQLDRGTIIINEWRKGRGLPEVPWGDVAWMDGTKVPIDSPEKPEPQTPPALAPGNDAQPDDDAGERSHHTRMIEYGSPEHEERWQRQIAAQEPWEAQVGNTVARLLADQRQSVVARLRGGRSAEAAWLDPFDLNRWIRTFREEMRPVFMEITGEAGEAAWLELNAAGAFDSLDPRVIRSIEQQTQVFAERVNRTTWNMLRDTLSEGLLAADDTEALARRIDVVIHDRITSARAEIAETEVAGSVTNGTLNSWDQSGLVQRKQWLSSLDERVRRTHVSAHGQTVPLHGQFSVGGASGAGPGQMSKASENIRCRCIMVPVFDVVGEI